jgi:hypothetical protein
VGARGGTGRLEQRELAGGRKVAEAAIAFFDGVETELIGVSARFGGEPAAAIAG